MMEYDKNMSILILLTILVSLNVVNGELPEQECPEDCDCNYFRINWVTDCSESNLTDIPSIEDGLSINVYILNMNGNQLRDISPFPADIRLRQLRLSDNKLTQITREQFEGLGYLLELDLSGNEIVSVDPLAFRDSPGLIRLEMEQNPLANVEGPFLDSRSLLYLDLSSCNISQLTTQFFELIPALNKLDLSGNPLSILEGGILSPLISLEYLKLNNCKLTKISPSAFVNNEHLKMIELTKNNLKGPVDWVQLLGNLNVLEHLDLRKSGIFNLPENALANSTWLRSLVLAENDLIDLDVATTLGHNLKNLFSLDLSNCNLKGPLSEDAFSNATNLRTLILSGNHMSASDLAVALAPLNKLQKLSLKNCSLSRLPSNTFHLFTCLQELDISRNPLNDAFTGLLSPLSSLERLDMGYSNLGQISKTTFSQMTSLKTLILSGNPLSSLEKGLFQNLTHLMSLELNYCGLTRLQSTVFPDNFTYPDLEELHLAGNPLEVPPKKALLPKQLNRLQTLSLANCNLTFIPEDALTSFTNITRLILSGNNLTSSENTFRFLSNLPRLRSLDLSGNKLTNISPRVFERNPEINSINLIENPWRCGCYVTDVWKWAAIEKQDIGILIGSTIVDNFFVSNGKKKKKALTCHFDSVTSPILRKVPTNKNRDRKEYLDKFNKTWARLVRESFCESSEFLRPARLTTSRKVRDTSNHMEVEKYESNITNIDRLIHINSFTTILLMISLIGIAVWFYRVNIRKTGKPASKTNNQDVADNISYNYKSLSNDTFVRRVIK